MAFSDVSNSTTDEIGEGTPGSHHKVDFCFSII